MNDLKNDAQFMKVVKVCSIGSVLVVLAGFVLSQFDNSDLGFLLFDVLFIGILLVLWKVL